MELRFDPRFPQDLESILDWYDLISSHASEKLRTSIKRQLISIRQFPESFQLLHTDRDYRGAIVSGYPLMIVFRTEEHAIQIWRVIHLASDWT